MACLSSPVRQVRGPVSTWLLWGVRAGSVVTQHPPDLSRDPGGGRSEESQPGPLQGGCVKDTARGSVRWTATLCSLRPGASGHLPRPHRPTCPEARGPSGARLWAPQLVVGRTW